MARKSKDWNAGYQAAIEAIKQAMQGNQNGSEGQGGTSMSDFPVPNSGDSGGQKSSQKQKGQSENSDSRTNPNDPTQGIVRPEDCNGQNSGVDDMPSTPGGFFSKDDGDDLAEKEGYGKDGGSESSVENDWKESALREISKMSNEPGTASSRLKTTIEGIYKVQTDWKKILQQVVGRSINTADTRKAYANKNILVSQDRVARTDKDKYDTIDYMIVFIDTSGSMSNKQIKLILSEVYSMALKKKPMKIYVMYCDVTIQHIDEYTNLAQLKKDAINTTRHGNGGTAVEPLWNILKTDKRFSRCKPDLIMIFTDGGIENKYKSNNNITIERDKKTMNWLVWCILDDPSINLARNDSMTKILHLNTDDIK